MSSAETTLYSILSTAPGITALVGPRIYPDLVPQGIATPYIGYERVATEPITTIHGTILAQNARMMIACWADTRIAAEALADAVAAAMQAAGHLYSSRAAELDDATLRLAATLDYELLIT
jgi:hypothetical protein